MKARYLLILTALAVTFAFNACNNASTGSEANDDSSASTTSTNTNDDKQAKIEANKQLVKDFYQSLFGDKDSTAIDKYIADNIKEHNAAISEDGKEALKNALRPFLSNPNIEKTKVDIRQVAADGDMVWLFVRDVAPNGKVFARVDIFRVEDGKIAENWKVSEPVAKPENKNGTF